MFFYIHAPIRNFQALLKGTPMQSIFFCTSWDDLHVALQCFKHPQAVYVRFSHIANFQPKFYVGSTSSFVLDREHSRYRKFLQVQQNKFVLAEVALRFWCRFDNFWMWSVFPIYTNKSNFWALEQALIQLWQPRLNTPFIYQFFNCRKGLISRTKFFHFTAVWSLLFVAKTPLAIYTSTSPTSSSQSSFPPTSTIMGNHPGFGQQLDQTLSHGKTTPLQ